MIELNGLKNWKKFKGKLNKQTMQNKFLQWTVKGESQTNQKC